jgi:RHS repeat-associated protein
VTHATREGTVSNLLQKTFTPYTAGKAGATVTNNYTYDIANQLLSVEGVAVGHDKAGDNTGHAALLGSAEVPGNRTLELSFSAVGQLSQIGTPLSVGGKVELTALTYEDGTNGELSSAGAAKLENSQVGVSASVTGATATYFTRTPSGEVLDQRTGATAKYYLADDRGTVEGTTDTSGTLQQPSLISYDPWGNTVSVAPTFGYLGSYQMPGGLDHFGERYYDPNIQRWTQPDPTPGADLVQDNSYSYAADDPVNDSDPDGTCAFDRTLSEPIVNRGRYQYFEICSSHGHRLGYLRVQGGATPIVKNGHLRLANLVAGTIGVLASTAIVAATTVGGGLCLAGSDGLEAYDCYKIMGIGYEVAAGGYIASVGIATEQH